MGKGKIGLYCYLTVDILIKVLQIFFFSIVAKTTERLKCLCFSFFLFFEGWGGEVTARHDYFTHFDSNQSKGGAKTGNT